MKEKFNPIEQIDQNGAMAQIAAAEQAAMVMGANDVESSVFNNIRQELLSGKISGIEAVRRAQSVVASKQDYH